jgi:hypothetical protein
MTSKANDPYDVYIFCCIQGTRIRFGFTNLAHYCFTIINNGHLKTVTFFFHVISKVTSLYCSVIPNNTE